MLCILICVFLTTSYSLMPIPTLFIPGLGGSRLIKNGVNIWPPDVKMLLLGPEKLKNIIKYDNTLQTMSFGNKESINIHSNYMKLFIKNYPFEKINQIKNIHMIPYDFRLTHKEEYILSFNDKLKKYIEMLDSPIQFLTHSSGGLLCHYFLHCQTQQWKKKYIHHVYNVNVPFTGTIMVLKQVLYNTIYDIIAKDFLISLGGVIMNFPRNADILTIDNEPRDYVDYYGLHKEYEIYRNTEFMSKTYSISTNVKTTIIYSTMNPLNTPVHICINNGKTKLIYGEGDGIVSLDSMLYPKIWSESSTEFIHIHNKSHTDILSSDELLNLLRE